MEKEKAVLAFSGGLDTTYCAIYLNTKKNFEVHAVIVNTGGFSAEEISAIEKTCLQTWSKVIHMH